MALPNLDKYEKYEQLTQGKVRYLEAGSGKDVLLLHGMGVYTSASTFQFMCEPLAAKYHVIALDYLGFGLPAPTPSWGELLNQGLENITAWHLVFFPLAALFFTLLLVVFIGEGEQILIDFVFADSA